MANFLEDLMLRGLGTLDLTKNKMEELIDNMVEDEELTKQQGQQVLERWQQKWQKGEETTKENIEEYFSEKIEEMGLAKQEDIEELEEELKRTREKISQLESELNELQSENK